MLTCSEICGLTIFVAEGDVVRRCEFQDIPSCDLVPIVCQRGCDLIILSHSPMKDLAVDDLIRAGCERERAECIYAAISRLMQHSQLRTPEDVRPFLSKVLLIPHTWIDKALLCSSPAI